MGANFKTNKFLLPLSWLYGLGVGIRNKLFDWGILQSKEFPIPVISIGNLSVGGTGKTPHTEYLIQLLSKKYKLAVLSRGYKRKSSGFVLADENASSRTLGDEPYQIFRKFPNILVAVDANRCRGIETLLALPEEKRPEVILLDDAFQHRYVKPSLSILLTDSQRTFYNDELLPAGRLREPQSGKERAQIILITKTPNTFKPIDYRIITNNIQLFPWQEIYFTSYKYKSLLPVFPETTCIKKGNLDLLKKEHTSILLLAGIADPNPLIQHLQHYTTQLETAIYPDHHFFTAANINQISQQFTRINQEQKIILTTEKDAMRLMDNPYLPEEIKPFIFYIPIKVSFHLDQEKLFTKHIENHVTSFKRDRVLA